MLCRVELTNEEWQWLLNVLAEKLTWKEANPMLMKIGQQLQQQPMGTPTTNSKEMPVN